MSGIRDEVPVVLHLDDDSDSDSQPMSPITESADDRNVTMEEPAVTRAFTAKVNNDEAKRVETVQSLDKKEKNSQKFKSVFKQAPYFVKCAFYSGLGVSLIMGPTLLYLKLNEKGKYSLFVQS